MGRTAKGGLSCYQRDDNRAALGLTRLSVFGRLASDLETARHLAPSPRFIWRFVNPVERALIIDVRPPLAETYRRAPDRQITPHKRAYVLHSSFACPVRMTHKQFDPASPRVVAWR
jgi:hypothetical protein